MTWSAGVCKLALDITCEADVSESPRDEIGRNWIIAIAALFVLLVLGIVLYLRMSAPIRSAPKRSALLQQSISRNLCSASRHHWV